jgi:hypothetical protein
MCTRGAATHLSSIPHLNTRREIEPADALTVTAQVRVWTIALSLTVPFH